MSNWVQKVISLKLFGAFGLEKTQKNSNLIRIYSGLFWIRLKVASTTKYGQNIADLKISRQADISAFSRSILHFSQVVKKEEF